MAIPDQPAGPLPTEGSTAGSTESAHALRPPPAETHAPTAGRSRIGSAFTSLVAGALVLILLLVFILENTQRVAISYFGATGHLSLGVALLLAAVGGALLVGLVAVARVVQLRHRIKRART